jgi:5'-nucleotidase
VAVSQAVSGFGVEGQGWDDMLIGQKWETAAAVTDAVVAGLIADWPVEPVVINVNVPNLDVADIRGWRRATVGQEPPRAMAGVALEPKEGHHGSFYARMSWGDALELPPHTDGGAVERGEVAITYLNRLEHDHDHNVEPAPTKAELALDALLRS